MAKPMQSLCKLLSDWEVDEARLDNRRGVPVDALAERYGVSAKTLQRAFKRMDERKGAIA
jgi:transposase